MTPSVEHAPDGLVRTAFQQRLEAREAAAGISPAAELRTELDRAEQFRRMDLLVGNTPLLRYEMPNGSVVLAKLECENATETHYDRVYLPTIQRLEQDGVIRPGDELWEVTSGSAGTSFAWVSDRLGYRPRIFVPSELPGARVQEMVNFGATLERAEPGYVPMAVAKFKAEWDSLKEKGYKVGRAKTADYTALVAERNGKRICFVNHAFNRLSPTSFETAGEEVAASLAGGTAPDRFISVLGNWTTTIGISDGLRRHYPDITVVGLEDWKNPDCYERKHPGQFEERYNLPPKFLTHESFGTSFRGTPLRFVDLDRVDEIRLFAGWAFSPTTERPTGLCQVESVGTSSNAALYWGQRLATAEPGTTSLVVFYDKADRYGEAVAEATGITSYQPSAESQLILATAA